jgi:hypothetical protein
MDPITKSDKDIGDISSDMGGCMGQNNVAYRLRIDFTIGYEDSKFWDGTAQSFESIVNTFAEWSIIRNENECLIELDTRYNEQFFVDNSLILCIRQRLESRANRSNKGQQKRE